MNTKENRIALIPARLESTRLAEKLLLPLGDKPIIVRTYEAVKASQLFNKVIVVCNHNKIAQALAAHNCTYILDETHFASGTDRIAAVAKDCSENIVVNVQGDEPFIKTKHLIKLIELFDNKEIKITSLKARIIHSAEADNPNNVKVVCNQKGRALYFSRAAIPFSREKKEVVFYKHIGLYGYRKETLLKLVQLPLSPLEKIEKLENLRMLENGFDIYLSEISECAPSIDTMSDYEAAIKQWM